MMQHNELEKTGHNIIEVKRGSQKKWKLIIVQIFAFGPFLPAKNELFSRDLAHCASMQEDKYTRGKERERKNAFTR